jgi:hypothetical protein
MSFGITGDPLRFFRPHGIRVLTQGAGLVGRMLFADISEEKFFRGAIDVLDLILDIRHRVRSHGTAHLPDLGPAIFACNHVGISDPIYLVHEIYTATDGRRCCAQVMRDDFFKMAWINRRMARFCNTIPFPRGGINRSNLDTFLGQVRRHLDRGVILFLSGTRSRTGEVMYVFQKRPRRDGQEDRQKAPGRLLEILLRGLQTAVQVVPTTLTYDFATAEIQTVFGPPVNLGGKEAPDEIRERVSRVIGSVETQVYVGPQHLLPCILHHPALERAEWDLPLGSVKACLQRASEALSRLYTYVQEGLREDFSGSFERALQWYREKGIVQIQGGRLLRVEGSKRPVPNRDIFLRDKLPSLFYWNQVKHLQPLRQALQEAMHSLILAP